MGNMDGMPQVHSGGLEDYTRDLTEMARRIEPVIGRDADFTHDPNPQSKTKNNPCIGGRSRGRKTALALGLAQRSLVAMFQLKSRKCVSLDLMNVVAGTRFRGTSKNGWTSSRTSKKTVTWFSLLMNCIPLWGQDPAWFDLRRSQYSKNQLWLEEPCYSWSNDPRWVPKAYRKDAALSRRFAKVTIEEPSVRR